MFDVSVQPVSKCSAVFCIVCSFAMYVVDVINDHMVEAYSSIGFVKALYVASNVPLCFSCG